MDREFATGTQCRGKYNAMVGHTMRCIYLEGAKAGSSVSSECMTSLYL